MPRPIAAAACSYVRSAFSATSVAYFTPTELDQLINWKIELKTIVATLTMRGRTIE